jgi:hypothetical protein
MKRYITLN